jgi:kelch-like protein 18
VSADGRIFAIGGYDGSNRLATVEAYTPSTNSWATVASIPTARDGLAAVVSADGRIFAIGGYDGRNELTTAEAYTP